MPEKNQLDFTCGISDDEMTRRFKEAIRIDEEMRKVQGLPQARYDDIEKRRIWNMPMEGKSMSEKELQPEVIVFAGPNGSGKSTITKLAKTGGIYINADDIKRANHCYCFYYCRNHSLCEI